MKERKSFTVAAPIQRPTTRSPRGSMTRKVGQASSGNRSRKALFFGFSLSIESHTTASLTGRKPASGKTNRCIDKQVWHHDAQVSTRMGFCDLRACASAAG